MGKIFLVEDNPDHAFLISRCVQESGHEIVHYSDGGSILRFFERDLPTSEFPEFILLDLKLPGMDGFEILSRIKRHPKGALIPVVILTTSKYQKEINRAYELGASGFVTKSEDFSELATKLGSVKNYWLKTVEKPAVGDET